MPVENDGKLSKDDESTAFVFSVMVFGKLFSC